jgi:formylglycine-generating enzyme required for sulfatase activity
LSAGLAPGKIDNPTIGAGPMPKIIISYRRRDSEAITGRIFDRLVARYGRDAIFRDIDNIAPGIDFRSHIADALAHSDILLAIVGPNWAGRSSRAGRARIDDDNDLVRIEVETALRRGTPVIPVLLGNTRMPSADHIPEGLKDFPFRQAVRVDPGQDFEHHVDRLTRQMDRILDRTPGAAAAAQKIEAPRLGLADKPPTSSAIVAQAPADTRWIRRITRRRAVMIAAGAAATAGAGVVGLATFVRRRFSQPALHTIGFEFAAVDENGRQKPRQRATAAAFSEDLGAGVTMDMVAIRGGSFTMGSPDGEIERRPNEGPQHPVVLAPFAIGAAPITQAQWLAVVMAHPGRLQHELNPSPSFFRGVDLPVESITWYEAEEYCRRLAVITSRDYRLPSEAQWEYACRAGTTDPFNVGPTITTEVANYCGAGGAVCGDNNGHSIASDYYDGVRYGSGAYGQGPVGRFRGTTTRSSTFPPNRFGLYDMHGNVWEFCLDIATASYNDVPRDGSAYLAGPTGGNRILRGGSWSHNPAICRSAYRDSIEPDNPGWQGRIGIRVVCG